MNVEVHYSLKGLWVFDPFFPTYKYNYYLIEPLIFENIYNFKSVWLIINWLYYFVVVCEFRDYIEFEWWLFST